MGHQDRKHEGDHARDAGDHVERPAERLSRRGFLVGGTGAALVAGLGAAPARAGGKDEDDDDKSGNGKGDEKQRATDALKLRKDAAQALFKDKLPAQLANGDDAKFADRRASFFKTLPQNDLGEVDGKAYDALLKALASGKSSDFDKIPLAPGAVMKLANPQAAFAFELTGLDGHATRIAPAPTFASALQAAEMGEVYWWSLTREVSFRDYETSLLIADAIDDLNSFSKTVGPKQGGLVTPGTLYRGLTPGDLIGPFVSQLLLRPVPYGASTIEQRYSVPLKADFMTDYSEWLAVQRGGKPAGKIALDPTPRYLYNNRALGEYVRLDFTYQAYLNAALILLALGPAALSPTNPYAGAKNQGGFVTFGAANILDLVAKAGNAALTGAWYQKWLVHRRLRPEVFAARVENSLNGKKPYGIDAELLGCEAVKRVAKQSGNRLLPMAYPEGSPTHPAYPAGHACIAASCCTILKAFFNEAFVIPNPVQPSHQGLDLDPFFGPDLTIGNELNKLANNVSLARCASGVHYRFDGDEGVELGEQHAIGILRDYSRVYNEAFDGFRLTRFDGQRIEIKQGKVKSI